MLMIPEISLVIPLYIPASRLGKFNSPWTLVSTALFVFLMAWDEFFFALIFTSTVAAKTVPVAIAEFTGRYVVDISAMMASGVFAAIPPVLLSLLFQRYIVSGLTSGAVKG